VKKTFFNLSLIAAAILSWRLLHHSKPAARATAKYVQAEATTGTAAKTAGPSARKPANVPPVHAASVSLAVPTGLKTYLPTDNPMAKTLLEGFALSLRADTDPQAQAELDRFAQAQFRPPQRALELARYGLEQIPNRAEFARERAGLISMLDEFGPDNAEAADIFHDEILHMEQSVRPDVNEATTQEERNAALSQNIQHAQCELAFAGWVRRQQSFAGAERGTIEIFQSVADPILRQEFFRAIVERWPASQNTLEADLFAAGLPVDRIRFQ
jgi:hypothetical protein